MENPNKCNQCNFNVESGHRIWRASKVPLLSIWSTICRRHWWSAVALLLPHFYFSERPFGEDGTDHLADHRESNGFSSSFGTGCNQREPSAVSVAKSLPTFQFNFSSKILQSPALARSLWFSHLILWPSTVNSDTQFVAEEVCPDDERNQTSLRMAFDLHKLICVSVNSLFCLVLCPLWEDEQRPDPN